jgi:hypothetical protein
MTEKRPWPNAMRVHRDRAAEEVCRTAVQIKRLRRRVAAGNFTRAGLERDLLEMEVALQEAARHLEAAGAETVPE